MASQAHHDTIRPEMGPPQFAASHRLKVLLDLARHMPESSPTDNGGSSVEQHLQRGELVSFLERISDDEWKELDRTECNIGDERRSCSIPEALRFTLEDAVTRKTLSVSFA